MRHKSISAIIEIIAGSAALLIGGLIYVLYRANTLVYSLFSDDFCGIGAARTNAVKLPDFIVYSLPGGLWSLAYLLLIDGVFVDTSFRFRLGLALIIPAIGVVSELLQGLDVLPGVFEMADLWCYAVPYLLYFLFVVLKNR